MKLPIHILALLLLIASCTIDSAPKQPTEPRPTLHPNDIVLKNDTVLMYHGDSLTRRDGDHLNGRLFIHNSYGDKIINYQDGWVTSLKTYEFDSVLTRKLTYVKGELHGRYEEWYANGNPKSTGYYKQGMKDSTWAYYYSNGNIDARGLYNPNYKIEDFEERHVQIDQETGDVMILSICKPFHSSPDGIWEFYSFSGEKIKTMEFKKGTIVSMEFGAAE